MPSDRTAAILLFDGVEVLDFAGPYEVFTVSGMDVWTVAASAEPITAVGGLRVLPDKTLAAARRPEILVVPGGRGTRKEIQSQDLISWLQQTAAASQAVLSVCTGALLLARAGLLDGLLATTHFGALDLLRELAPAAEVVEDVRYVDNGHIVLSAGIAAGIDAALHLLRRLEGLDTARHVARRMEYRWEAGSDANQGVQAT